MTENPSSPEKLAKVISLDAHRKRHEEHEQTIDYAEYFALEDIKYLMLEVEEILDQQADLTEWIDIATDTAANDEDSILRVLIAPHPDAPWLTKEFRMTYPIHNPAAKKALDIYQELGKGNPTDNPVLLRYTRLHRLMSALIYARIVRNDYDAGDIEWQERADKILRPRLGDFPSLN